MDFKRLTDAIFSRLEPYQLARHYKFAELIYTDGEDLPASWCDGELRPVVDEREWNEGIMYIRQNGVQSTREDEASAFIGCQVMQIGTIPLKLVVIARRSERFTPFDVAQTISSAVSGLYSNLALQIGAQYVNVINTVTESNARVVLEEEFKDLEKVSFDSNLYAISVEIEVEVKGDAACMASDACDPIVPEPILNKVATPVFDPTGGVFGGFGEFTLSCSTPGASIYYTLDGSPVTPQTGILYTGTPVLVVTSKVPKAKAFLNGLVDSDTATAQFQVDLLTLSFNIAGGVFPIDSPPTIVPIINNIDADVYYTTDGSTPTELSTPFTSPFIPTQNTTLTGRGFLPPALPSNVVQQVYQLKLNAPVLDTTSGTFISERLVSAAPAAIGVNEYRIDGGAWVVGDSVLLTTSASVDWRAVAPNYVTSDVVTVNVTIQCAAPTISPNGGVILSTDTITLATSTAGASIRYTTDGSTPTESSTLYTTPFTLPDGIRTVTAKAFKAGCEASDVAEATFGVGSVAGYIQAENITSASIQLALFNFVDSLVADGIWAKLDAVYPFLGSGRFNLKDPRDLDEAFRLQFFGGVTITDAAGAIPNGTDGYAETFYDIIRYNSQDGISFGCDLTTAETGTLQKTAMGLLYNGTTAIANIDWTNTASPTNTRRAIALNVVASTPSLTNNIARVFVSHNRPTNELHARIGANTINATTAETAVTSGRTFFLFARNRGFADLFSSQRMAFAFIGRYLTLSELNTLITRYNTFKAAIGR